MKIWTEPQTGLFFGGILVLLCVASFIGWQLRKMKIYKAHKQVIDNLNQRMVSWWLITLIFMTSMMMGEMALVCLFSLVSFLALREFVTLTATNRADHRSLFWAFFVILPLNYGLLILHWYGLFAIFIPVYAYLWIPVRNAIAAETENFLNRAANIQWGLMVYIYFISYTPALLDLHIPGGQNKTAMLLWFLIFIVQMSDVLQYVFGKCFGKHKICPAISPNKTVEGFVGGMLATSLLGACLYKLTPFTPGQAAVMSLVIILMGFVGGMVMSAIKRDRGVKDYGNLIPGHGGIIDRIDSLCFAAPVFFHLTRYFFAS